MHDTAKKHTEKIVLETEVETRDVTPSLPIELMSILETSLASYEIYPSDALSSVCRLPSICTEIVLTVVSEQDSMTLLLAWMLVFDLFVDAVSGIFIYILNLSTYSMF
jgi:hypothetical protein